MPPNRSRSPSNLQGRLDLAVDAIRNEKITTISEAARVYGVPRSTLTTRLRGVKSRDTLRANGHKLTLSEEESLKKWIISLDTRGASPRQSQVREMASLLLADRGDSASTSIGVNWVRKFVQRHQDIRIACSRRYDYKRALNEDPKIMEKWFTLVQSTIASYGVDPHDIYNFDETGFAMGISANARVITRAEYYGKKQLLQPGNREWVTSIECISAAGWVLPPTIIFKGKVFIEGWFDNFPPNWRLATSTNGWTTDQIGLDWLKNCFIPSTSTCLVGKYRLLILDGHGSHLTPEFDRLCTEHNIIPLCMPAHASHLLQPLDVGCFSILKRSYGTKVQDLTRVGVNHIDKLDFLHFYPQARVQTFKPETIISSFTTTGLVPLDPSRVILKLNIELRTPTPPPQSSQSSIFSPKTPQNQRQLKRQVASIKRLLRQQSRSPDAPILRQVDQLVKSNELQFHQLTILRHELAGYSTENKRQIQKRSRSRAQIAYGGSLSATEAYDLIQSQKEEREERTGVEAASTEPTLPTQTSKRRPPTCSNCNIVGHRITACPTKQ